MLDYVRETLHYAVDQHLQGQEEGMVYDVDGLDVYLKSNFSTNLDGLKDNLKSMENTEIKERITEAVFREYQQRETQIGAERMRHMERMVLLNTIDSKWKDHLYAMDQLKEGIGLRSFAHRDPLIEYKKEGFAMFEGMYASIGQEVSEIIFKIQPVGAPSKVRGVFSSLPQHLVHDELSPMSQRIAAQSKGALAGPESQEPPKPRPIQSDVPKVGRNDPCPCGSGKKYKKCCGQ